MRSWLVVLSLCLACASAVAAQAPSASETAAARSLFEQGLRAVEEQRWQDALDAFQRSYGLVPRASTLLNIASAQSELGLFVEAMESYRTFLAEADGRAARYREEAESALAALEPRVAQVSLRVPDIEPGDELLLDGRPLPAVALEVTLPMNPGSHRLVVQRDGQEIGSAELVLVEGEERGLEMALHPIASPVIEAEEIDAARGENVMESPWLWVGVGAGAAVVAAIIVVAVVVTAPSAYVGNLGPGTVTF